MDCNFLENITIQLTQTSDIDDVLRISDKEMGPGYLSAQDVQEYIDDKKTQIICAKYNSMVVGVGVAFTTGRRDIENEKSLNLLTNHFAGVETIGAVKTIMTDSDHQHKGIGTKLVKSSLDFLKKEGAQACYAVALKMLGTINIGKILDQFKFEKLKEIEDFWAFKSIEWDFICPACGEPPCRCSAVIYALHPIGNINDPIKEIC